MANEEFIQAESIKRNHFDLSHKIMSTYKKGHIYPINTRILETGDRITGNYKILMRKLASIVPGFDTQEVVIRNFAVPIRVLFPEFMEWATGFKTYDDQQQYEGDVPRWEPKMQDTNINSLWVHLGYPANCVPTLSPASFKVQAYYWIYDYHFRYKVLEKSILKDGKPGGYDLSKGAPIMRISRDYDYFTTGLTSQQLGEEISIPMTGDAKATFNDLTFAYIDKNNFWQNNSLKVENNGTGSPAIVGEKYIKPDGNGKSNDYFLKSGIDSVNLIAKDLKTDLSVNQAITIDKAKLENNVVSLKNISAISLTMLRQARARQLKAEMLMRTGLLPNNILRMNWGISPSDEIYGYPEYLGGYRFYLVNSEVLQTSQSTEGQPLGQMGGHTIGAGQGSDFDYRAKEPTVFMSVMYIKTENVYGSQGMPREDLFIDNEDAIAWPQYQHLSEQKVYKQEILCKSKVLPIWTDEQMQKLKNDGYQDTEQAKKYNEDVFMFQPIYQYKRAVSSQVRGLFIQEQAYKHDLANNEEAKVPENIKINNNLYFWTQARFYSIVKGKEPTYNMDFIYEPIDTRNNATVVGGLIEKERALQEYISFIDIECHKWSNLSLLGTPRF